MCRHYEEMPLAAHPQHPQCKRSMWDKLSRTEGMPHSNARPYRFASGINPIALIAQKATEHRQYAEHCPQPKLIPSAAGSLHFTHAAIVPIGVLLLARVLNSCGDPCDDLRVAWCYRERLTIGEFGCEENDLNDRSQMKHIDFELSTGK